MLLVPVVVPVVGADSRAVQDVQGVQRAKYSVLRSWHSVHWLVPRIQGPQSVPFPLCSVLFLLAAPDPVPAILSHSIRSPRGDRLGREHSLLAFRASPVQGCSISTSTSCLPGLPRDQCCGCRTAAVLGAS